MLKDIEPIRIPLKFGKEERYLRYNLNANRYLEYYFEDSNAFMEKASEEWTTLDLIHLLRAGLMDSYFTENERAINEGSFDKVVPSIAKVGQMVDEAGGQEIVIAILEGLLASYPDAPKETDENF